jgi:hypothetical protein
MGTPGYEPAPPLGDASPAPLGTPRPPPMGGYPPQRGTPTDLLVPQQKVLNMGGRPPLK